MKNYKQHPKKAGRGRKPGKGRQGIALDRAVLDLVAVAACAIALVICASLGDGEGVGALAGALVGVLTLRSGSEGKTR